MVSVAAVGAASVNATAPRDTEYVDFSPTHEFQRVLDHLTGAAAPADA